MWIPPKILPLQKLLLHTTHGKEEMLQDLMMRETKQRHQLKIESLKREEAGTQAVLKQRLEQQSMCCVVCFVCVSPVLSHVLFLQRKRYQCIHNRKKRYKILQWKTSETEPFQTANFFHVVFHLCIQPWLQ